MHIPQTTKADSQPTPTEHIWVVGMSDSTLATMHQQLPEPVQLETKNVNDLTKPLSDSFQSPDLLFITLAAWTHMLQEGHNVLCSQEDCKMVLVLEAEDRLEGAALADMVEQHFLCAITMPLTQEKVTTCREKARELMAMYDDIYKMTNEIILERELLARKNEQLDFLNKILTKASKSLDPRAIIHQAGKDVQTLVDVESIMGIFWNTDTPNLMSAELFMPPNLQKQDPWVNYLLDQGECHARHAINTYQIELLNKDASLFKPLSLPDTGNLIQLPLIWNETTMGLLCIVSNEAETLGRDRVQILRAVANHLALALRNALMYRTMKNQADHDGLTRIFNRQHFERRIAKELKRHQRYQNELSLLMLDLDHFKRINDTYGHLAGDLVLREVADMLRATLRESDIPARYGGEEFVVILPHTQEEDAWILAERIRQKIAAHTFKFHDHYFQVTTSMGISSVKPSLLKSAEYLVSLADQALYLAKTSGRNMVCRSAPPSSEQLCVAELQEA
ncbi:MAG: GGDEF domain-containing protein [Deltaproteobacteria bacterium]|nr:MAG: GGDEF domain-containing protein [Deltaproteobacteria bacterium]